MLRPSAVFCLATTPVALKMSPCSSFTHLFLLPFLKTPLLLLFRTSYLKCVSRFEIVGVFETETKDVENKGRKRNGRTVRTKQLILHRSSLCRLVEKLQAGLYEIAHGRLAPLECQTVGSGTSAFVNELASTGKFVKAALNL